MTLDEFQQKTGKTELDFRVRYILRYAQDNLSSDLSLQALASIANLSIWHVCRLFNLELGLSPEKCIKLIRVKAASRLLTETCLNVKQIMYEVGITDESHFVRDFKTIMGKYPTEYRSDARPRVKAVDCTQGAKSANISQR